MHGTLRQWRQRVLRGATLDCAMGPGAQGAVDMGHADGAIPSPRAACAQDMMGAWPPKAPRVPWRLQVGLVGSERRIVAD